MKAKEWNELEITFTWEAGEATLDIGTVTVSYHPVTDDLTKMTRYASGPTNDVIEIEDCTTTLLFPYVTTMLGFDTGLVITNASEGSGTCMIDFSGPDAPEDTMTPKSLAGEEQWVNILSNIAPGFQGYITAKCDISGCARLCLHHRRRSQPGAGLSRGGHFGRLRRPIA